MPAKRSYGMDQEFYPWSPIVTRPVLRWPDAARVALAVVVNLEHWDWEVPPGTPLPVSPMGGPEGLWTGNQPAFPDIGGFGKHKEGKTVGDFRVLPPVGKNSDKTPRALCKTPPQYTPILGQER